MQRTPRTGRTVAENKSRDTILKDEKNTIYDRLKIWINSIYVFSSAHFLKANLYITAFIFLFFCSSFSAFRRNDFGVKPLPSLQASGKLFWDARIISGAPKHNLPCSFEHEFFIRKIKR